MAAVSFTTKLKEDGSLAIPKEAAEELGLRPGDPVQVRLEIDDGVIGMEMFDRTAAELLQEARRLKREPGKPSNDPAETAFGEILKEKYRKQGFKL